MSYILNDKEIVNSITTFGNYFDGEIDSDEGYYSLHLNFSLLENNRIAVLLQILW